MEEEREILETVNKEVKLFDNKLVIDKVVINRQHEEYAFSRRLGGNVTEVLCTGSLHRVYGFFLGYKYLKERISNI